MIDPSKIKEGYDPNGAHTLLENDSPYIIKQFTGTEAHAAASGAVARLQESCSKTWPRCPSQDIICDCKLTATHVINELRDWVATSRGLVTHLDGDASNFDLPNLLLHQ